MDAIAAVSPYTKSRPERLASMQNALYQIDDRGIEGDIVECGVWRGGNMILARMLSPKRVCWLYDTFAGMTMPTKEDVNRNRYNAITRYKEQKDWDKVTLPEVRQAFEEMGVLDDSLLHFIEGPVEQTLLIEDNLPKQIALLRLDTDWYASTKVELEVLYPRLQSGGVLIVDDYGHWLGAQKAVNDYLGRQVNLLKHIDYSAVAMVKP